MSSNSKQFLQAEIDRASREIRGAIGKLIKDGKAPAWVVQLSCMLDKAEFDVTTKRGASGFVIDEKRERVAFRASTLGHIWTKMAEYTSAVGTSDDLTRECQLAINQFVIHEMLHIRQNFPNFATVATIKDGLPGFGLLLLDIAADTAAAWLTAIIEICRLESPAKEHLPFTANALIRAFVIGTRAFDARKSLQKRQRALGLLISAALVQAKHMNVLQPENLFDGWSEEKPVICFDLSSQSTFNAIVMDGIPGILINNAPQFNSQDLLELWDGVGQKSTEEMFRKVVSFLSSSGIIVT